MDFPVFHVGQNILCLHTIGYALTRGAIYHVVEYEPSWFDPDALGYTWPPYVHVIDDDGDLTCCHATRFEAV